MKKPGLSLRCKGELKAYSAAIGRNKLINAKYGHKNYRWKEDSKSRLPGWNFVTFRRPTFKNIFAWFTEYEPNPYKKPVKNPRHPNTAYGIYGLDLLVRAADRTRLESIFGKKLPDGEVSVGRIRLFVESGRATRLRSLVLKCKSLNKFLSHAGARAGTLWRGRKAAVIKNPDPAMWDIYAVQI